MCTHAMMCIQCVQLHVLHNFSTFKITFEVSFYLDSCCKVVVYCTIHIYLLYLLCWDMKTENFNGGVVVTCSQLSTLTDIGLYKQLNTISLKGKPIIIVRVTCSAMPYNITMPHYSWLYWVTNLTTLNIKYIEEKYMQSGSYLALCISQG